MRKLVVAVALSLMVFPVFGAYKGRVFVDQNHSGKFEKNEPCLSGVAVTDGRNVVKTDRHGCFTLPGYEKTKFITVTTPSGYVCTQYYHPVSDSIGSYDFAMQSSELTGNKAYSFLQITDTEIMGGASRWVSDLKNYIRNEHVAFLIHTGDICYEGGLKMHKKILNTQTVGCPVYYGIGNHDLVAGKTGEALFESIYGPTWYSFDVGNVHYVMTPMRGGDHQPSYTLDEVATWLKNDLAQLHKGQSVVLFNHDLLFWKNDLKFGTKDNFVDLSKYDFLAEIFGHWHYNNVFHRGGAKMICTSTIDKGGIDHSASTFREIRIDKNNHLSTVLHNAYIEPRVSIVSPQDNAQATILSSGELLLSVNAYDSKALVESLTYEVRDSSNRVVASGNIDKQLTQWNWTKELTIEKEYAGEPLTLTVRADFVNGEKAIAVSDFRTAGVNTNPVCAGNDWAMLLGNSSHDAKNNAGVKTPLQLKWVNNTGTSNFMTSPLIVDHKVIAASCDDNTPNLSSVCAFDLATGHLLWKYKTENSVKNSIAAAQGIVVAQDADANLYGIRVADGSLAWKDTIDVHSSYTYLGEGLTISGDTVFAGAVNAYALKTGKLLWENKDWNRNESATTTVTLANDLHIVYAGSQWGALYANDSQTGRKLWSLSQDGLRNRGSSPLYKDGKLYVTSPDYFFILDAKTGAILTQKKLSHNLDATCTPIVTDDEYILGTADKGMIALDKNSLAMKWVAQTRPSLVYTVPYSDYPMGGVDASAVLVGNTLYFGGEDGWLYAVNSETGEIVQQINLGAPIMSTVAVSGNVLAVSDYSGNVSCFVATDCPTK